MREGLFRIGLGLTRAVEGVAAILLFAIVVLNFLQVVFRYVVQSPLGWTEEMMRYSIAWVTYLAAIAALFRGEHMVVDVLGEMLSPRIAAAFHRLALGCVGTFCLVLVWEGFPMAFQDAAQLSPAAEIRMIWPHISVAIGGLGMLVVVIIHLAFPPGALVARLRREAR